jgi:polyisoprenoid-binding protein YceI
MKKFIIVFLVMALPAVGIGQNWKSDRAHSRLSFTIRHMLISDVTGIFKTFDINMKAKKADFSDATIEFKADVSSIDTEENTRDKNLRGGDFFEVDKYPNMQFKSTSIKKVSKNNYLVKGNLTLHGATKPVTLNMTYRGTILNPKTKKSTAGFQITAKVNRSDFAIGESFPSGIIGDEAAITADAEMQLQ